MIRAMIIDDEDKGRKLLSNLLEQYCPEVEVVGTADSVASAEQAIGAEKPDLLFLDIVMPNENGFDLLDRLAGNDVEVIFTTAYDQFAIRAIRACALDYLLKPIDCEELQASVERASARLAEKKRDDGVDSRLSMLAQNARNQAGVPLKVAFPTSSGIRFLDIDDIFACKADGNYTTVFLDGQEKLELVSKPLRDFADVLSGYHFMRTHRSYLVNLRHIVEYRRSAVPRSSDGEGGCVVLANGMKVPVAREKRRELTNRITGLA